MQLATDLKQAAEKTIHPHLSDGAFRSKKSPLTREIAIQLLDLLSTDDAYRNLFERDPGAALSLLGHAIPVELMCAPVSTLASKHEIASARRELMAHITSTAIFKDPHCFEAGMIRPSLTRK